ncbi:MAG: HAD domain-containing protein [Opitutaceae bacterium]
MSKALDDAARAVMAALEKDCCNDLVYGVRTGAGAIAPWPTEPGRFVFLDFDGVLNSEQSVKDLGTRYRFPESTIGALNTLLQQRDTQIVITSTWREVWTLSEIAGFLDRDGVLPGRVVGSTPLLQETRGLEIDAWLRSAPYPVASFVILDDHDDMAMHGGRLVQTDPRVGLTRDLADRAIQLLATPWKLATGPAL